jgi:hypothetical protein
MPCSWSLHVKERFAAARCRRSDISPCPPDDSDEEWTKHPITWPREGDPTPGTNRLNNRRAPTREQQRTAPGEQQRTAPGEQQRTAPGEQQRTAPGEKQRTAPGEKQRTAPGEQQRTAPGEQQAQTQ